MIENHNIFNYISYVKWLNYTIKINRSVFGYKAKLAEAADCQRSYLSQVLNEKCHLTLEHAIGLAKFWNLNESERDYFLNLVNFERASTLALKDHYKQKLIKARNDRENLSKRIQEKVTLPEASAAILYSHWYHLAILMALTIPSLRRVHNLAARFELPSSVIVKVLNQLMQIGLVETKGEEYLPIQNKIHLSRDSHFNALNHAHWRSKAIENSYLGNERDIHYSSVCTLSREDAEKIRQLVFQCIDDSRKIISPSIEEEIYCINLDWFLL